MSENTSHSDARFIRTVKRIGAEAFWLHTYHNAICGMTVDAIGLDFFRVSLNALADARLIRLIRILEDDSQTASFWYLYKANKKLVRTAAEKCDFDIQWAKAISNKFKIIRNNTFVHIDKDAVFDPQKSYEEADITHDDIEKIIEQLWCLMQKLHFEIFHTKIEHDDYTGEDIKLLAELRDRNLDS
ncbi:MAG: hypothetical protein V3U89_01160 [Methylophilaceae bacterium]